MHQVQDVYTGASLVVLFDLVRSNSLNVNGCSIEDLCAKTQLGETLLMAAVRKNNPTLLKDMLDKNLPREIKDFRENEVSIYIYIYMYVYICAVNMQSG